MPRADRQGQPNCGLPARRGDRGRPRWQRYETRREKTRRRYDTRVAFRASRALRRGHRGGVGLELEVGQAVAGDAAAVEIDLVGGDHARDLVGDVEDDLLAGVAQALEQRLVLDRGVDRLDRDVDDRGLALDVLGAQPERGGPGGPDAELGRLRDAVTDEAVDRVDLLLELVLELLAGRRLGVGGLGPGIERRCGSGARRRLGLGRARPQGGDGDPRVAGRRSGAGRPVRASRARARRPRPWADRPPRRYRCLASAATARRRGRAAGCRPG